MKNILQAASRRQVNWEHRQARIFERWLGRLGSAVMALCIITFGPYLSYSALSAAAGYNGSGGADYVEISELSSLDRLRSSFQNDVGKVRIIALLSPT